MCGRYTLTIDAESLAEHFHLTTIKAYYPRYNIAPGQKVPVIGLNNSGKRGLAFMRWGLIPRWAKEQSVGYKMINARAETVEKKPAFKDSFFHRRCLIPADGFYEWKNANGKKIPYRFILPDKSVFTFAGIWSSWTSPEGNKVLTCCIITTSANEYIKDIHDRMPVILADEEYQEAWLSSNRISELKSLLQPYSGNIYAYQVSKQVNSPHKDNPDCIKVIE